MREYKKYNEFSQYIHYDDEFMYTTIREVAKAFNRSYKVVMYAAVNKQAILSKNPQHIKFRVKRLSDINPNAITEMDLNDLAFNIVTSNFVTPEDKYIKDSFLEAFFAASFFSRKKIFQLQETDMKDELTKQQKDIATIQQDIAMILKYVKRSSKLLELNNEETSLDRKIILQDAKSKDKLKAEKIMRRKAIATLKELEVLNHNIKNKIPYSYDIATED